MGSYRLRLLEPPCLLTETDRPGPVPLGAKQLSLLAYLALEPGPHGRDELATLLWSESPTVEARASLRQALKHLRDALGPLIECDRATVRLAGPLECDVVAFRRAAAEDPARASGCDLAQALTGLSAPHAPAFEEWVDRTRGELLRQYREVLAVGGRAAIDGHDWPRALAAADRWLAADPLSSAAARLGVEACYLAGDRRGALARFAEFRRRLRAETGEEPDRALLALVRRVEADAADGRPILPPDPDGNGPVGGDGELPALEAALVERDEEWRALVGTWRAVREDRGAIVLLEGEAGTGKSRLASEFGRWVTASGGIALQGRGYSGSAGISYGAITEALREAANHPAIGGTAPDWLAEVARLLPELRQRFPGLPAAPAGEPVQAARLFEAVAQVLLSLAAEGQVVVTIDDLQWCDEESCGLLLFLTRRLERAPILWLGGVTLGELERDAPASRLCRVWRVRPQTTPLTLAPLSAAGVWTLVSGLGALADTPESRRFAGRLHEVTRGNPFYIQELLKTLFATDVVREERGSGAWTLRAEDPRAGGFDVPMPRSVHETIADRVDRLGELTHDVLVTVAVAELACNTELLSHVHGISRLHVASVGDALLERRLVVETGGGYRCAHPVIGQVVREGLSPSRRREVHRALALALDMLTLSTGDVSFAGDIARHAEQGDVTALAYRAALAASRTASGLLSEREALGWVDRAAASARTADEIAEVNRLTALLLEGQPVSGALLRPDDACTIPPD